MIELNQSLFIGEGSHRATYQHPADPGKCLKVVKPGTLEHRKRTNKKWYKRLRKLSAFDETHKDVQAYKQFGSDPEKLRHIPLFYGMVETSRGSAMLLDRIINEDGTAAQTLTNHLERGQKLDQLTEALLALRENLINTRISIRDFATNDVLVRQNQNGTFKLYIIDGFGGSEFIPLSVIPYFARKKAARRVNRFFHKIMQRYPELELPLGEPS